MIDEFSHLLKFAESLTNHQDIIRRAKTVKELFSIDLEEIARVVLEAKAKMERGEFFSQEEMDTLVSLGDKASDLIEFLKMPDKLREFEKISKGE